MLLLKKYKLFVSSHFLTSLQHVSKKEAQFSEPSNIILFVLAFKGLNIFNKKDLLLQYIKRL